MSSASSRERVRVQACGFIKGDTDSREAGVIRIFNRVRLPLAQKDRANVSLRIAHRLILISSYITHISRDYQVKYNL